MRRISLALALVGAVAAAGCGGGAKTSSDNGGAKGVADGTFTVTVQNGQGQTNDALKIKGGYVVSTPAGIDCGVTGHDACSATFPLGTSVSLAATAVGTDPAYNAAFMFLGFAGDCQGSACTLSGNADKYVVAMFAGKALAHPNFTSPMVHAGAWADGTLRCTQCHGQNLTGAGIAPSCSSCHSWPITSFTANFPATVGHFDVTAAPWGDHNGWAQACQRCHTDQGFRDFMGELAAPTEAGVPSADYLTGTQSTNTLKTTTAACLALGNCDPNAYSYGPLKCQTCHNSVTNPLAAGVTQVKFPSAVTVTTDNVTALCGQCHQARESSSTIDAKINALNPASDDAPFTTSFLNPHYLGATATLFGSDAAGWAQYTGKVYTAKNQHGGVASCTTCHNAHNGALPYDDEIAGKCGKCHFNEAGAPVSSFMELEETRQFGFEGDIDGDGIATESVKAEIDGLAAKLYSAMQQYATDVLSTTITYGDAYPYFTTGAWSRRQMKAAVNYKWYKAEPGAWAHNPRYAIEVLFDSIEDLNAGITAAGKVPTVVNGKRAFNGHFGAAEDPSPYAAMIYHSTGAQGFTSAACYQCHGGQVGLTTYLSTAPAALASIPVGGKVTAMQCTTCHMPVDATAANFKGIRSDVTTIYFPPQKAGTGDVSFDATTSFANAKDRVCATCHTARENTASVDASFVGKTGWTISFVNPHYLGAAGVMFGGNAHMMYEYTGKTYAAYPAFWQADMTKSNGPHGSPHAQNCTSCHNPQRTRHTFEVDTATSVPAGTYNGAVNTEACDDCHVVKSYGDFRLAPLKANVKALSDLLYTTIQSYTATAAADQTANPGAKPACYSDAYPYWFDASVTSNCTANLVSANGAKLDQAAAKAAFNYKWSVAEPGAYAHNYEYMVQALIDSIQDLNPAAVLPNDAKTGLPIVRP